MSTSHIRVRFAPSPTGLMHLGNVRTALMNYLFALQKNGTFVLRVEDTDPERNFDPGAKKIIADLNWLRLTYTEGPGVGGPFAPYFQSERMDIYKQKLDELITMGQIYRCFCTIEDLEKKRQRQIALRAAPRYDRACFKLSKEELQKRIDSGTPFVWRIKLDHDETVKIKDIAHDEIKFELKNFSDFPITRQNGTYTFMFANFVDDMVMEISHVLRGEDHLTNTAGQAALYQAFGAPLPVFWHLPILCNIDGKKLSKRDFGFSLRDLRNAGYLPEAICNYLAIIGGSFEQEIMPLDELAKQMNFDHAHAKGQIKYDVEKLRWINRKWIAQYDLDKLTKLCRPYLEEAFPKASRLDDEQLTPLIKTIQTDLVTLKGVISALHFYFEAPETTAEQAAAALDAKTLKQAVQIISKHIDSIAEPATFLAATKDAAKKSGIGLKSLLSFLRLALIGSTKGPGVQELLDMLEPKESERRIRKLITTVEAK